MKYTDVLRSECIDEYIKMHHMLYPALMKIGSEISLLQTFFKWQEDGLKEFNPAITFIYKEICDAMITRINSTFFDTGKDTASLNRFKNHVFAGCQDVYKDLIVVEIAELFKKYEECKEKCEAIKVLRNHFTAHILLTDVPKMDVSFDAIEALVIAGCELFHALSFEVASTYEFPAGYYDGIELYAKERKTIKDYTQELLENQVLSSEYIRQIDCKYIEMSHDSPEAAALEKRKNVINRINQRKKR